MKIERTSNILKQIQRIIKWQSNSRFSSMNDELDDNEIDRILFKNKKQIEKESIKIQDIDQVMKIKEYEEDLKDKIERMKKISQRITGQNEMQSLEVENTNQIEQIQESNVPGIKYFKYGLPIPNIDPEFKGIDEIMEEERLSIKTINENMLDLLELNETTSYQEYEQSLQQYFNHEQDMYGEIIDVRQQTDQIVESLGECGIPMMTLNDKPYMNQIKRYYTINISLPGCIETENPNRFIKGLRPIEEFRNTPLIPVSDAEMRRHNERVAEYHRSIFYFEVKKETIFNYAIFGIIIYIGATLVTLALDKQDEMGVAYQRLQLERIRYN